MASELEEGFRDLLDAQDESTGKKELVWIEGISKRAFVEELTSDEINIMGGVANSGGFRVHVAVADFPNKPEQGTEIEARGMALQVLSSVNRNGVTLEITAGDPSAEVT